MDKYKVCGLCAGEGTVVDPAIDAGGISADEFFEDEEFANAYRSGAYDITCPRCKGKRVIEAVREAAILDEEDRRADARREAAREDGDVEAYRTASDRRWGGCATCED